MYGIFILPYTVSLRFVWEEGKDIGLLERGLNSTEVNGDGRAIIKGGGIKLFLVSVLYFRRGCGYYVLRNILERGPYLLLCASPCCIGPSRWWILICWGWLDTCLTGCRKVLRRVIQIVFNTVLNVTSTKKVTLNSHECFLIIYL